LESRKNGIKTVKRINQENNLKDRSKDRPAQESLYSLQFVLWICRTFYLGSVYNILGLF
jgi:hypothetical protein